MKTVGKIITLIAFTCLLSACGVGSPQKNWPPVPPDIGMGPQDIRLKADQVTRLSTASVNFHAVSVTLESSQNPHNHVSFTVARENVKTGYSVDDNYDNDKKITVDAIWSERHYAESSNFPTYVHFVIKSLTEQEAVIEVSARLINLPSGDFINLPLTLLRVQGADLATLTEKR